MTTKMEYLTKKARRQGEVLELGARLVDKIALAIDHSPEQLGCDNV
jgi:hypothetical protein